MDINNELKEFTTYTNSFLEYGEKITLKIEHTKRVVDLSEFLAKTINLNEEEIYVAKLIGLLHDIGRFKQWKEYKTFADSKSIDHADLGVDILKDNNYLRKYNRLKEYDDIILDSIKYHNKLNIPTNLSKDKEKFIKLIRDADKIDILYLYTTRDISLELDNEFSNDIYNSLINRKAINRKKVKNVTDRLSISLGFIFDINYYDSFKYLKEKNYYNKIIEMYKNKTNNEKLKKQLEEIKIVIDNYIEEMLKNAR